MTVTPSNAESPIGSCWQLHRALAGRRQSTFWYLQAAKQLLPMLHALILKHWLQTVLATRQRDTYELHNERTVVESSPGCSQPL